MSLVAEYDCEACGQHVAFDDDDYEPYDEGLCKTCYDNEFIVYCSLHVEGELVDYETFVNIKDDSSIRSYIREYGDYEKGKTVTIKPIEDNLDIQEEIDYYTTEGRNQFII